MKKIKERPCRNCHKPRNYHQSGTIFSAMCYVELLSIVVQQEIADGNMLPGCDLDLLSFKPMNNLEYLEYKYNEEKLRGEVI